ncbi:uncharacterized protein N7496_002388 [Penicillium cataractarum]|uniref:Aminoglycoside phosphotransferase domain-containing protein n=1 Tax=Penicillium cataractarum TaxID=2100454 RepID=A0A9W9VHT5_9EURO|nr:uncharacterized protein N7496_002388 [Penicillium cataractarum]KAJ5379960.1 hypothetical protein N7496_002388 [Penicillium cataractarum]
MTVTMGESTDVVPRNIPDELAPIFEELRHTQFACTAIDEVPGQRINSTLYAALAKPLPNGSTSVVIKHTKGWDAPWLGISIAAARCVSYALFVQNLSRTRSHSFLTIQVTESNVLSQQLCPVVHEGNFTVRPPRLLHFIPQHSTQVIERLENTSTLPEYLRSSAGKAITAQFSTSLGHAIGKWLSAFHAQNSAENGAKPALQQGKIPDRDLYVNLYLGTVDTHIKMSPKLFEDKEEALRSKVAEGLKKDVKGRIGLIHGDLGARQ